MRRVHEHQQKLVPGFTAKYHVHQLVWYVATPNVAAAIAREKQINRWTRAKKMALVSAANPDWRDLSQDEGFFRWIR